MHDSSGSATLADIRNQISHIGVALGVALCAITACSSSAPGPSSSQSTNPPPVTTISGVVDDAFVVNATVTAYQVSTSGVVGACLPMVTGSGCASAATAANGTYSLTYGGTYSGPLLLESTGGSYTDTVTDQVVPMPGSTTLWALLSAVAAGTNTVAQVTGLTTVAAQLALQRMASGASAVSAATASQTSVQNYFGYASTSGSTVTLSTPLLDLTQAGCGSAASQQDQFDASLVLAGIAQMAAQAKVTSAALTQAIIEDIVSDGKVDGLLAGTAISVPLTASSGSVALTTIYGSGLAQSLEAGIKTFQTSAADGCHAIQSAAQSAALTSPDPTLATPAYEYSVSGSVVGQTSADYLYITFSLDLSCPSDLLVGGSGTPTATPVAVKANGGFTVALGGNPNTFSQINYSNCPNSSKPGTLQNTGTLKVVSATGENCGIAASPSGPFTSSSLSFTFTSTDGGNQNSSGISPVISCSPPTPTYTLGGTVSGLASGATVMISNQHNSDQIIVSRNGPFTLPSQLGNGEPYSVTATPSACAVTNGSGAIAATNVTNLAVSCPVLSHGNGQPLFAYIGHSFAMKTVPKYPITAFTITDPTTGAFSLTIPSVYNNPGFNSGYLAKVQGAGAPYDGYLVITSPTNGTPNSTYTGTDSRLISATSYTPTIPGTLWLYDMGSSGGAGYSVEWASVARAITGNAFLLPPSYVYAIGGGRLNGGGFAGDIGFDGWITALLTQHASRPDACLIDFGVNDIYSGVPLGDINTPGTMIYAAYNGFKRLAAAGIIPIVDLVYGGGTATAQQYQQARAYDQFLLDLAKQGLIIAFDASNRIIDPSSPVGAPFPKDIPVHDVHLTSTGSIDVALSFKDALGSLLPAHSTLPVAQPYGYSSSNPNGTITPVINGVPAGIMTGAAPAQTLTSTRTAIGGRGGFTVSFLSGGASAAPTALIGANTDTFPDGTPKPGYELVVTFPAGTWAAGSNVVIELADVPDGFVHAGASYTAGDAVRLEAEVDVDSAGLTGGTNLTPSLPIALLYHYDSVYGPSGGYNLLVGTFVGRNAVDASAPQVLAQRYTLATPVFGTPSTSRFFKPMIELMIGGNNAAPIVYRIRGAAVRKVDPIAGEPF